MSRVPTRPGGRRLLPGIAVAGLALMCGGFAPPAPETIEISRRHWFFICAGVCPNFDVVVRPDGRVWVIRRHFDTVDDIRRFRVSAARAARVRAILEPFRPNADTPEPDECRHDATPEEAELIIRTVELEVKWARREASDHLIGCDTRDYDPLREAMGKALESLGLGIDAAPLER